MKKLNSLGLILSILILIGSCGPIKKEQFVEISPNETGFLVPLEGKSKAGQKKMQSVDYLNSQKLAAKRISLPLRKLITGRMPGSFKYIPTMRVIKVNRALATREWTSAEGTGTSNRNEALWVESLDSIGFGVGVVSTAMIQEEDTALFLYKFAGVSLERVMDSNIRGHINAILSREFAKYPLAEQEESTNQQKVKKDNKEQLPNGRAMKNSIFKIVKNETIEYFKSLGITITSLGLSEGLVYADEEIQKIINDLFMAEMNIQKEAQITKAQKKINSRLLSIAINEKEQAQQFKLASEARISMVQLEINKMEAQAKLNNSLAKLKAAEKWNGQQPEKMIPSNASMLFNE